MFADKMASENFDHKEEFFHYADESDVDSCELPVFGGDISLDPFKGNVSFGDDSQLTLTQGLHCNALVQESIFNRSVDTGLLDESIANCNASIPVDATDAADAAAESIDSDDTVRVTECGSEKIFGFPMDSHLPEINNISQEVVQMASLYSSLSFDFANNIDVQCVQGFINPNHKVLQEALTFVVEQQALDTEANRGALAVCEEDPAEAGYALSSNDTKAVEVAIMLGEKYRMVFQKYRYHDSAQAADANANFLTYRYVKKGKNGETRTIYDSVSRKALAEILRISEGAIVQIEFLIEDITDMLGVVVNGDRVPRGSKEVSTPKQPGPKPKPQTWNKRPDAIKFRVYAILKAILWEHFHFQGKIIELFVKRLAYITAQNRAKARKLHPESATNCHKIVKKHFGKHILKTNPRAKNSKKAKV